MDEIKTFDTSENGFESDPLYRKQHEGVSKMRSSLLACSNANMDMVTAIQNVTVMRIYHQLVRLIKYTELMDKLEQKLYASIEYTLDANSEYDPAVWSMLLKLQSQLQTNMIESQKLIDPYLNIIKNSEKYVSIVSEAKEVDQDILDSTKRENLRLAANAVLADLDTLDAGVD